MKIEVGQIYYLEYKNMKCYAEVVTEYLGGGFNEWATYEVKVIKFFGGSKGDITLDGQIQNISRYLIENHGRLIEGGEEQTIKVLYGD